MNPINPTNQPYLIHHFLENSAGRFPDKVALICEEKRLTYREINRAADKLRAALIDIGIKRQDRAIIFMDNSVESVISLFGILKAGAIFVMLNPAMKAKKLHYILKDSGARFVIIHMNKSRIVKDAVTELSDLENIIWVGRSDQIPKEISSDLKYHFWEELLSSDFTPMAYALNPEPSSIRCIDMDLATIIYTSGSTGEPKGVMSAHYNMISATLSITTYLKNTEDDIILNALPLSFDYGLYQVLMAFYFGGTVVLENSFVYPYRVIEHLIHEKVTGLPIVPTMLAILLQMEDLNKIDFSSLRYISNTAAALPTSHIRKLRELLPQVEIYSMYGLTECKRVSYLPPDKLDQRPGSVGIPMSNEEVFIVNDKGEKLGLGEIGELVVRGSNVMQGYWNDPEETAKRFRPGKYRGDTWLYTGDLFKKDEDGYLYFVARMDDLIKTKGERVSPKEIENMLCELDGVAEAAVIGIPDDIFGQVIKAFIVAKNKNEMTGKKIKNYCMSNLEPFMIPKSVEFLETLPKTASGKIDKKRLAGWEAEKSEVNGQRSEDGSNKAKARR